MYSPLGDMEIYLFGSSMKLYLNTSKFDGDHFFFGTGMAIVIHLLSNPRIRGHQL